MKYLTVVRNTEAAIQRATAALEMARLNLSYTVVLAPCDGQVRQTFSWKKGSSLQQGNALHIFCPIHKNGLLLIIKKRR